jgi:hypothetical protein
LQTRWRNTRFLCLLGRHDEAEAAMARTEATSHNVAATARAESVRALLALERGAWDEAVGRARHAAEIAAGTDSVDALGESNEDLATVLEGVGERAQARAALRRAYAVYARKGHVGALSVRERLAASGDRALRQRARKP